MSDNVSPKLPKKTVQCERAKNGELYYRHLNPLYDPANADKLDKFEEMRKLHEIKLAEAEKQKGNHAGEACKTENALTEICELSPNGRSIVISYRCIKNTAGKLVLDKDSASACDNGAGKCSKDGKCLPGKACSPDKFKSHCSGNEAVVCMEGKEHHLVCAKNETCSVTDGEAKCTKNVKTKSIKNNKSGSKTTSYTPKSAIIIKK